MRSGVYTQGWERFQKFYGETFVDHALTTKHLVAQILSNIHDKLRVGGNFQYGYWFSTYRAELE